MKFDHTQYLKLYEKSIKEPQEFWGEMASSLLHWDKKWQSVYQGDFSEGAVQWFQGGELNVSYNCLDRHLDQGDKIAILWEGDSPDESKKITYRELHEQVCKFSNVLKKLGVQQGDRICIYLPMIPEIVITMLACTRIGAVHSVVFAGFSAESLQVRIQDADCKILITADEGLRGSKRIPLKANADEALKQCPQVQQAIIVKRTGAKINWNEKDLAYDELMQQSDANCPALPMEAEKPLFILYTSGSTGAPKGILHTTGGYLLYVTITYKYIFDYQENDIYWCTADCGWITGHSYLVYGPLSNGATILIYEGVPHYPTIARYWEIVDKYKVTIFYSSPTAIRALRKEGEEWLKTTSRKSLRLLGTVGEPINPDVWQWYYQYVGLEKCPIVDTWWQTETGGIMISPFPHATPLKAGSASWPFFGILPQIVSEKNESVDYNVSGSLIITQPWPGMLRSIYKNQDRFYNTYFKPVAGAYLTGDSAYRDEEGYFWISGRNDDVIKVSGHRIGTGEVESALLKHPSVSEAAVVAVSHDIKGQAIYAYVIPKTHVKTSNELKSELIKIVRSQIGAIAAPEHIQWAKNLPKTRSGKIMRRILRKIANNDTESLGDLSTLIDPNVIEELIKGKKQNVD